MTNEFGTVFGLLKAVLEQHAKSLSVKADTAIEYTLITKSPSPFHQHKGQPLYFGSVRLGKAYVSFHLMALYMNPTLTETVSPALKKRMRGKTCFNFKIHPGPEALSELKQLTQAGFDVFEKRKWL